MFERFLTENEDRMEDIFIQMDKDGSGDISLGELKMGLKDFGLRLTSVSSKAHSRRASARMGLGSIFKRHCKRHSV